jgi:hypothetical protein
LQIRAKENPGGSVAIAVEIQGRQMVSIMVKVTVAVRQWFKTTG